MEEIVSLFANNGIGVACIIYFMWYNSTTMKDLITTLNNINNRLIIIETELQKRYENEQKK